MMRFVGAGAIAWLLNTVATAVAAPVYEAGARVDYIAGALDALASVSDEFLADTYHYLYVVERNQCQAPTHSLAVGCLLEAARRSCRQRDPALREPCHRVSDVIITNRLSEKQFLPRRERYAIMRTHTHYRRALVVELRRRYAALVTEMTMTQVGVGAADDRRALAEAIESYCQDNASARDLSWQHCAAAVVWFVGTSGRDIREGGKS